MEEKRLTVSQAAAKPPARPPKSQAQASQAFSPMPQPATTRGPAQRSTLESKTTAHPSHFTSLIAVAVGISIYPKTGKTFHPRAPSRCRDRHDKITDRRREQTEHSQHLHCELIAGFGIAAFPMLHCCPQPAVFPTNGRPNLHVRLGFRLIALAFKHHLLSHAGGGGILPALQAHAITSFRKAVGETPRDGIARLLRSAQYTYM